MSGIVPSMTMPEFTIDSDVRHFITDMDAAVKDDAKDILLSYTVGQLDSVTKVFQVMLKEFKKREKCVAGLNQLKQDTNENFSIYASKIRRYVREMGVNAQKFDKISIDYLNWILT